MNARLVVLCFAMIFLSAGFLFLLIEVDGKQPIGRSISYILVGILIYFAGNYFIEKSGKK